MTVVVPHRAYHGSLQHFPNDIPCETAACFPNDNDPTNGNIIRTNGLIRFGSMVGYIKPNAEGVGTYTRDILGRSNVKLVNVQFACETTVFVRNIKDDPADPSGTTFVTHQMTPGSYLYMNDDDVKAHAKARTPSDFATEAGSKIVISTAAAFTVADQGKRIQSPNWSPSGVYVVGDCVTHALTGIRYICTVNVGPVATTPDDDTGHWTVGAIIAAGAQIEQVAQDWDTLFTYVVDDLVIYLGHTYRCNTDAGPSVADPVADAGAHWDDLGAFTDRAAKLSHASVLTVASGVTLTFYGDGYLSARRKKGRYAGRLLGWVGGPVGGGISHPRDVVQQALIFFEVEVPAPGGLNLVAEDVVDVDYWNLATGANELADFGGVTGIRTQSNTNHSVLQIGRALGDPGTALKVTDDTILGDVNFTGAIIGGANPTMLPGARIRATTTQDWDLTPTPDDVGAKLDFHTTRNNAGSTLYPTLTLNQDGIGSAVFWNHGAQKNVILNRDNGTPGAETKILNGNTIGSLAWRGATDVGPDPPRYSTASIRVLATENWLAGSHGGSKMEMQVTENDNLTTRTALELNWHGGNAITSSAWWVDATGKALYHGAGQRQFSRSWSGAAETTLATNGAVTLGSLAVTCDPGTFAEADVGKFVMVIKAGVTIHSGVGYPFFSGYITIVNGDGSEATLDQPSSFTETGCTIVLSDPAASGTVGNFVLNADWTYSGSGISGVRPQSVFGYWGNLGPRGALNVEGTVVLHDGGVGAPHPIPFQNSLIVKNAPGEDLEVNISSWGPNHAGQLVADGATITVNNVLKAVYGWADNWTASTMAGGTLDMSTIAYRSFATVRGISGSTTLKTSIGYWASGMGGFDAEVQHEYGLFITRFYRHNPSYANYSNFGYNLATPPQTCVGIATNESIQFLPQGSWLTGGIEYLNNWVVDPMPDGFTFVAGDKTLDFADANYTSPVLGTWSNFGGTWTINDYGDTTEMHAGFAYEPTWQTDGIINGLNPLGTVRAFVDRAVYSVSTTTLLDTTSVQASLLSAPTYNVAIGSGGTYFANAFYGVRSQINVDTGVTLNFRYGVRIEDKTGSGTIAHNVGLHIAALTGSTIATGIENHSTLLQYGDATFESGSTVTFTGATVVGLTVSGMLATDSSITTPSGATNGSNMRSISDTLSPIHILSRARAGTTAPQTGDTLGTISFSGFTTGSTYQLVASVRGMADENFGASNRGGRIEFLTSPSNAVQAVRGGFDKDGIFYVGTSAGAAILTMSPATTGLRVGVSTGGSGTPFTTIDPTAGTALTVVRDTGAATGPAANESIGIIRVRGNTNIGETWVTAAGLRGVNDSAVDAWDTTHSAGRLELLYGPGGGTGTSALVGAILDSAGKFYVGATKSGALAHITAAGVVTGVAVVASGMTGATTASKYAGGTTSGKPLTGTFALGDFVIAQDGHVWVCTTAGVMGSGGDFTDAGAAGALGGSLTIDGTYNTITGSTGIFGALYLSDTAADGPTLTLRRGRTGPGALSAGDEIGVFTANGYNSGSVGYLGSAQEIRFRASEAYTAAGARAGQIEFYTSVVGGNAASVNRVTIDNAGTLHVAPTVTSGVVSASAASIDSSGNIISADHSMTNTSGVSTLTMIRDTGAALGATTQITALLIRAATDASHTLYTTASIDVFGNESGTFSGSLGGSRIRHRVTQKGTHTLTQVTTVDHDGTVGALGVGTAATAQACSAYMTSAGEVVGTNVTASSTVSGATVAASAAQAGAVLTAVQGTVGNPVMSLTSTATNTDPTETVYQFRVTTTDTTLTQLGSVIIPASTTVTIIAVVTARRTGGSAGTANDGASYLIMATFKNVGGTATLIGSSSKVVSQESQAGFDADIIADSSPSVQYAGIRVTGTTNNNITWHATVRTYAVSS